MFVINFHALTAIHLLDFVYQVLLDSFLTRDTEDVVWNQWSIDQRLSGLHDIARVHEESFSVWHEVFFFDTTFATNNDAAFTTFLFDEDFDGPIDFSDD